MSLTSHLQELRRKHETLSNEVKVAERQPATDPLAVTQLKKEKLKLKEEITRLAGT